MTAESIDDEVIESHERQKFARRSVYVAAKLVKGERSEDCEILNISAGGAKVRVSGPLDKGVEVEIAVGSHGSFPAKVAWCSGSEAGVQFLGDPARAAKLVWDLVENPEVEREGRHFTRTSVLWTGRLGVGGRSAACRVLNISAFGAGVRLLEPLIFETAVNLRIERFGDFPSDVVWKKGEVLGISFRDDPEDIVQIFGLALPALRD